MGMVRRAGVVRLVIKVRATARTAWGRSPIAIAALAWGLVRRHAATVGTRWT